MALPSVDLRSDTVTRPTAAMRRAMADAEVGDDVFGDDPTVQALERRVAALAGKEMALFVPSGTMGNQLAVHVQTRPADEVLLEAESHIYFYEQGGIAANSGCLAHPVKGERGVLPLDTLIAALRDDDDHVAREGGLKLHLDGARLWNASVATGVPIADFAACADTVMMCFSKGLGAPVGSILTGPADTIRAARRARKRWGGGMRQVGILAAAALHAMDHHVARLADDHRRAKRLADGFASAPGARVIAPDTNIVFVDLDSSALDARAVVKGLAEHGVRMSAYGPRRVRAIAHLDVDDAGIERAIVAFHAVLAGPAHAAPEARAGRGPALAQGPGAAQR